MRSVKGRNGYWLVNQSSFVLRTLREKQAGTSAVEWSIFFVQEEEAKARKAKEEEAAALEFEKWKGAFSVDAEGTTEAEVEGGNQDLLTAFVEYIKVKPVML